MGMAIITLKVTVEPATNKMSVFVDDMAAALASRVEKLGRFHVDDREGYRATCEVTNVELVIKQFEVADAAVIETWFCRNCGSELGARTAGRPRVYCSDSCRQAAYRERHTSVVGARSL